MPEQPEWKDWPDAPGWWPKLSITLPHRGHLEPCNACGREDDGDVGLSRWQEHDMKDEPTPVVVVLCRSCSDAIIEPHPRLYRRMDAYEPMPGSMKCCLRCHHRSGLTCTNPLLKSLGGPGLPIRFPKPTPMFVDGRSKGRNFGYCSLTYYDHPKCDGFEVKP